MYPPTLQFVITISIDHREAQPGTRPFQLKNFHNHHIIIIIIIIIIISSSSSSSSVL